MTIIRINPMITVTPNRIRMNFPIHARAASRRVIAVSMFPSPFLPHDISYGDGGRGIRISFAIPAAASHFSFSAHSVHLTQIGCPA